MLTRVEKHIKSDQILFDLCFKAKNLYNRGNYIIRQKFIESSKLKTQGLTDTAIWIRYKELYDLINHEECYQELPAQTSQAILRVLDKNWNSYFNSIKIWKKTPSKFLGMPKMPKYLNKKGLFTCVIPGQNLNIKDQKIRLPKTDYKIKTKVNKSTLKQVRLVPTNNKIKIEIIYEKEINDLKLNKNNVIGIDLGVNNLMAITSNQDNPLLYLVNGRPIKSINQFYNKQLSKYQSILKVVNGKYQSRRINRLSLKRKNKINDYFHKSSRWLLNLCIENDIGRIVIGKNEGWKQKSNMGKTNNQNFVQIPFAELIDIIKYKGEELGIEVDCTEESHTSKVDHLAIEGLHHQVKYLGKRIRRGLFQSSTGNLVNSDINGSIGMLRKENVASDDYLNSLACRGCVSQPIKLSF